MAETVASEIRRIFKASGRRVVVQDVGGYLADALVADPSLGQMVKGAVEETKQGLWRYQKIADLPFPVIQIADSSLKQIEARYVGAAVALSALEAVRALGVATIGERVAVVGYGDIGSACARAIRGLANTVHIWDVNPIRRIAAISDGFLVATPAEIVQDCRLVIGCSGMPSVEPEWFEDASGDFYLASGSSRDIEFRRVLEASHDSTRSVIPGTNGSLSVIDLAIGRSRIRILRGGLPINFQSTSLPHSVIDLVFAQLTTGLVEIESVGAPLGVGSLSGGQLEDIASIWLTAHGPRMREISQPVEIERS